jgi:hypothetical protein
MNRKAFPDDQNLSLHKGFRPKRIAFLRILKGSYFNKNKSLIKSVVIIDDFPKQTFNKVFF